MAKHTKPGTYQSPLNKLFTRQQPKVRAKKNMAQFLLFYAEKDHKRIAQLLSDWMQKKRIQP